MNTGFGFSEMLVIITLILIFFGSKELPAFLREIAKITAKVRRYSDRIKRELDDVARSTEPQPVPFAEQIAKKKELRSYYASARHKLTGDEQERKSDAVMGHLLGLPTIQNATMIMVYVNIGAEVQTRKLIQELFARGKRVVIPYCLTGTTELGVAEIKNLESDVVSGVHNTLEPRSELRKTFFKSDLQVILCPGVAFDTSGGRLGRGKGYYDTFLRELRGRLPLIGIAYQCQILTETLPFEYHDIPMDIVVTEEGIVYGAPPLASATEPITK